VGATEVVSVWDKINSWMAPLSGMVDNLMRPLVQPLADQFDSITGDSESVKATAEKWRAMADKVKALGEFQTSIATTVAGSWDGQSSEAFQQTVAKLVDEIEAMESHFDDVAEFLDDAAMEVKVAEDAVEAIIRELIEWALLTLAVSAALSIVTLGASAVAGAGAAAARAAVAGSKIATILTKVAQALEALAKALKALKAMKGLQGFAARALVKTVVLKPVVSAGTGLTGSPLSGAGNALVNGLRDIAVDEYDDQVNGENGIQTPARDDLDDVMGPVADGTRGGAEAVDGITKEVDDAVPSLPGSK
jgi:uncharacterized protein YukE